MQEQIGIKVRANLQANGITETSIFIFFYFNTRMKLMTSWDDGAKSDLKLAQLLKSYQLPGIFFLPNAGLQLSLAEIRELALDFEIGGHTVSHPHDMKDLVYEDLVAEIWNNKMWLETVSGQMLEWFCYPRGRYDDRVIKAVQESGFKYARTTLQGVTDWDESNPYRIHTSVHVYDYKPEYGDKTWLEYAKGVFLTAKEKDGYFHLWGHSWEIDRQQLWGELEELFKFIHEHRNN